MTGIQQLSIFIQLKAIDVYEIADLKRFNTTAVELQIDN